MATYDDAAEPSPGSVDFGGELKLISGCGFLGEEARPAVTLFTGIATARVGDVDGGLVKTNESRSSKTLLGFGDAGAELDAAVSASSLENVRDVLGDGYV